MNVDSILEYKKDPSEDFYGILGCDRNSSDEQISTEFKIRAKECHPDKSANRSDSKPEVFPQLLKVCRMINSSSPFYRLNELNNSATSYRIITNQKFSGKKYSA